MLKSLYFLFVFAIFPLNSHSQEIRPGNNAHENLKQARDFLRSVDEELLANIIAQVLRQGEFETLSVNNIWGKPRSEEGFSHITGVIQVRNDFLHHDRALDMNDPAKLQDFADGARLAVILVHEAFHWLDYQKVKLSPEMPTYKRSFVVYRRILSRLISDYQKAAEARASNESFLSEKVQIFAGIVNNEMSTYSDDRYGAISGSFSPLFDHEGCVDPAMNHMQFADYSMHLSMRFTTNATFEQNYQKFDEYARYAHPASNNQACFRKSELDTRYGINQAVGFAGPRSRQIVYEVERVDAKSWLKLQKLKADYASDRVTVTVAVSDHRHNGPKLKLLPVGRLFRHQKQTEIRFDRPTPFFYVIVSSDVADEFPEDFRIRLSRTFHDNDGFKREGPVTVRELSLEEQARMLGFFPIHEQVITAKFDKNNFRLNNSYYFPASGFYLELKKGDFLKVSAPQVFRRFINFYKLGEDPGGEALRPNDLVKTIFDYHKEGVFSVQKSGTYLLVASHPSDVTALNELEVSVQISRNKTNPREVSIQAMDAGLYQSIGMQRPLKSSWRVPLDWRRSPINITRSGLNFKPGAVLSLSAKKGDLLKFQLPGATGRDSTTYILKHTMPGFLERVHTWYHYNKRQEFMVPENGEYFLAIEGYQNFSPALTYPVEITHFTRDRLGPKRIQYHQMTDKELSLFHIHPVQRLELEKQIITRAHPKGFIQSNGFYQLYLLELNRQTQLHYHKASGAHESMRFVVTKLDERKARQGVPALLDIRRNFKWHKGDTLKLEKGIYVVAVEVVPASAGETSFDTPFELVFSTVERDVVTGVKKLTTQEMRHPAMRLQ